MNKGIKIVGSGGNRSEYDFYSTPQYATNELLVVEKFNGNILEPACGDGAISKILVDKGYDVISKDLVNRGYGETGKNFLWETAHYDNLITNPPFSLAEEFLNKAKQIVDNKIALLLKTVFLEGQKRYHLFQDKKFPLKCMYQFAKRINFDQTKKAGMVSYAWFVWERDWKGEPVIRWINK